MRRAFKVVLLFAVVLAAAGIAACAWTKPAIDELASARADLARARRFAASFDAVSARAATWDAQDHLRTADARLGSVPLCILARIPVIGNTLEMGRQLASAGLDAVQAADEALAASAAFPSDGGVSTRLSGGAMPLGPWLEAAGRLSSARTSLASAVRRVESAPSTALLPEALAARTEFLSEARGALAAAARLEEAAQLIPPLLGSGGRREYLVVLTNGAVARAAGGIVDALAVVSATKGTMRLEPVDATLAGGDPTRVTPEAQFPAVATRLAELYRARTGRAADGVIALDQDALASLIAATGPVPVGDAAISASLAVRFLTHDSFVADPGARARYVRALFVGALGRLLTGTRPVASLADSLAAAAKEKHLLLWSSRPAEQDRIRSLGMSGSGASGAGEDLLMLVSENQSSNKIDTSVERTVSYDVVLASGGRARARAEVSVRNRISPSEAQQILKGTGGLGVLKETVSLLGPGEGRFKRVLELAPGESGSGSVLISAPQSTATGIEYRLRLVRSPGIAPDRYAVTIHLVKGYRLAEVRGASIRGDTVVWEGPLERDREIVVRLVRPWWSRFLLWQ